MPGTRTEKSDVVRSPGSRGAAFLHWSISILTIGAAGGGLLLTLLANATGKNEPPPIVRIACVGDSLTASGYPDVLQRMLGDRAEVANLAVDGARASDPSSDNRSIKVQRLTFTSSRTSHRRFSVSVDHALQTFKPDVIVVLLGSNNAREDYDISNFESDYLATLAWLRRAAPGASVVVALPPTVDQMNGCKIRRSILLESVRPTIERIARQEHLRAIDFDVLTAVTDTADGVHPSESGRAKFASLVYDYVRTTRQW